MISDEIEKSLDLIIFNWMAKNYYSDMTEGQVRKSLHAYLNPTLEEIKILEDEISDSYSFAFSDTDELVLELSRKKMKFVKMVSELMRVS